LYFEVRMRNFLFRILFQLPDTKFKILYNYGSQKTIFKSAVQRL
jgi:hypothetical protein